jgi:hypothetical protein
MTTTDNYNIYDNTNSNPQMEFRSPLRDPLVTGAGDTDASLLDIPNNSGYVSNTNAMLLRAALAAVNTLGLRDNSQNVISKTIVLPNNAQIDLGAGKNPANYPVAVEVFSNAPNPVISEIFVCTYTGTDPQNAAVSTPQGYVAIELYNPYSVPLTLTNWQLGLIDRTSTTAYPNLIFKTTGSTSVIGSYIQVQNNPLLNPADGKYDLPVPVPGQNIIYIPAHGYALLENYNATGPATQYDATGRPSSALGPATGGSFMLTAGNTPVQTGIWYGPGGINAPNTCDVYVQNLQLVISGATGLTGTGTSGELVLLRPRLANGTYTSYTDPDDPVMNTFNEGSAAAPNLYDLVPVDSYDFSGAVLAIAPVTGQAWSYVRIKGGQQVTGQNPPTPTSPPTQANPIGTWFMATFPGFYLVPSSPAVGRQAQTMEDPLTSTGQLSVPWQTYTKPTSSPVPEFGVDTTVASYVNPYPPIQVYNLYYGNTGGDPMHFPNSVASPLHPLPNGINGAGTPNMFPLGGFARNGSILDVPFIGAYRIRAVAAGGTAYIDPTTGSAIPASNTNPPFVELNSLPMDCSFAAVETENAAQDQAQNIGRFIPMAASYQYVKQSPYTTLPDYYSWARNIFNYLTVQASSGTSLPSFDPNVATSSLYTGTPTFAYPPQNQTPAVPTTPALTANAAATDQTAQDNVGVEGLININTASWKVLSMLPFTAIPPGASPAQISQYQGYDRQIAQNIVNYRLKYGPFTSIFDLSQVPGFQSGTGATAQPIAPTSAMGLLSPADQYFGTANPSTTATGVGEDYQWDCFTLDRISNLITTRSDTFTVYIVVQGWQNVGVTNAGKSLAQPMVTRRYAFIVDRSAINGDPGSRFLKTLVVPND